MLHSRYAIAVHLYQMAVKFEGETFFTHQNPTKLFAAPSFQSRCHCVTRYPSVAPDTCAICNMLWLMRLLPANLKTERFLNTSVLGYGTLLIEQASSVFHSCFKEFGHLCSLNFPAQRLYFVLNICQMLFVMCDYCCHCCCCCCCRCRYCCIVIINTITATNIMKEQRGLIILYWKVIWRVLKLITI